MSGFVVGVSGLNLVQGTRNDDTTAAVSMVLVGMVSHSVKKYFAFYMRPIFDDVFTVHSFM
jgi:hypothetical protein